MDLHFGTLVPPFHCDKDLEVEQDPPMTCNACPGSQDTESGAFATGLQRALSGLEAIKLLLFHGLVVNRANVCCW